VIGTFFTALSRVLLIRRLSETVRAKQWIAEAKAKYAAMTAESKLITAVGAVVFLVVVLFA
jgi:ABC-type lipoprotein release transport system permease subunit